jgi:membrane protein
MKRLKNFFEFVVGVGDKFAKDRATRLAAALAYYMMFSLAPLLAILAGIVGRFLDESITQEELSGIVESIVGEDAASFLVSLIDGISAPSTFTIATLISLGILFWGASNLFHHLKETLNIIWGVRLAPGRPGIIAFVKGRLLAFGAVIFVGILIIAFFFLNTVAAYIVTFLADIIPSMAELVPGLVELFPEFFERAEEISTQVLPVWRLVEIVQFVVAFFVVLVLLALIYKFLPDVEIAWQDVMIGAAFTAGLITLGTIALSIYFRISTVGSLYGAAGTIMIILLWFYYTAQMFLVGAVFTAEYAAKYGSQIHPADHAIAVELVIDPDNGTKEVDGNSSLDEQSLDPGEPYADNETQVKEEKI